MSRELIMRVGIVGVGFMGWIHYLAYQRSEHAKVVAFCSRDEKKRAGDWTSIQGNFGPPGEQIDVSGLSVYTTLSEMLEGGEIDMVDLCLPPELHAGAIRQCYDAGVPVLCEKPLALDDQVAQQLLQEALPGALMVAHILPLMNEFEVLYQAVRDQSLGKPIAGRFQRTISPPDWIPDFYDPQKVGGPLLDLHVHDAHLIRLLFGMPVSAKCASIKKDGVPKRYETVFEFDDAGLAVSCGGGVIDSPARPFTHGYEVTFEKATVRFEFAAYSDGTTATIPVTILHNDGRIERPSFPSDDPVDAFVREVDLAAQWVDHGQRSEPLDPALAVDALKICQMQMK